MVDKLGVTPAMRTWAICLDMPSCALSKACVHEDAEKCGTVSRVCAKTSQSTYRYQIYLFPSEGSGGVTFWSAEMRNTRKVGCSSVT